MGRPTSRDVVKDARAAQASMQKLRDTLHLSRAEFGRLIGKTTEQLLAREQGLTAWRQGEVASAQGKIRTYLAASLAAFESTFGEPAFPEISESAHTLTTNRAISMKLARTLDSLEKATISDTLEQLTKSLRTADSLAGELDKINGEKQKLADERAALQRGEDTSRAAAESITVIGTQIGLIERKATSTARKVNEAYRDQASLIRGTAELIGKVLAPLRDQFRSDLAGALTPFSKDPYNAANVLIGNFSDGFNALDHFLKEGRSWWYDHPNPMVSNYPPEALRAMIFKMRETLQRVLDGKEVWAVDGVLRDRIPAQSAEEEEALLA